MIGLGQDGVIIPVAGGKGGTGKSCLVANLGLALSQRGVKTLMVDLDLGGSNLHTLIGQKNVRQGLGRLLVDKTLSVVKLIHPTPWPNLDYLPGDNQVPRAANLHGAQKNKIMRGLTETRHRAVICDLGAGSALNTLDFFLQSRRGIVLFTPELTSLLNAYLFLRNAVYRAVSRLVSGNLYAAEVLADFRSAPIGDKDWDVARLAAEIERRAPDRAGPVAAFLKSWRPGLVINMVDAPQQVVGLKRLADLVHTKLDIQPLILGALPRDPAVTASVNRRIPVMADTPQTDYGRAVAELAGRLLDWRGESLERIRHLAAGWRSPETRPAAPAGGAEAHLEAVVAELLPVVDDLGRAAASAEKAGQTAMAQGLKLTLDSHLARLAKLGVETVETVGRNLDPKLHEAVETRRQPGVPKGRILAEVAKGFTYRGRLIRPAKVIVAD